MPADVDERAPEPGVDAGGFLQEPGVLQQPFGAGPLRSTKQRAHHLLNHADGGIGQSDPHLHGKGHKGREPSPSLQPPEVLGAHDRRLAGDDGIPAGMNVSGPVRLDSERADVVEPFQQGL